eukprot:TRINITY_DN3514_c0_g3_i1.p1 TRINITY_DN3514_c0_g3~~TRINITY_DN3514_c0_g3_i1.p1  ORF type:complete len:585 (+),score=134.34 TRINITY_DN3514_c0_g3_i1:49-1803(+)
MMVHSKGAFSTVCHNINACLSVGEVLKTSFGPYGKDKLFVHRDKRNQKVEGNVLVSNDGATILRHLKIHHPAARIMLELAIAQDNSIGDGTTSVVLLTCGLLRRCLMLIHNGIHTNIIIRAFRRCCDCVLNLINETAIPLNQSNRYSIFEAMIKTSMGSKIISRYQTHFTQLLLNALKFIENGSPLHSSINLLRNIHIVTVPGASMGESSLLNGVLVEFIPKEGEVYSSMPFKKEGGVNVLVCKLDLEYWKSSFLGAKIKVDSHTKGEQITQRERDLIQERMRAISLSGVDVLFHFGTMNEFAEENLTQFGVTVYNINNFVDIELIGLCTGTLITSNLESLPKLGRAQSVDLTKIGEKLFLRINEQSNNDNNNDNSRNNSSEENNNNNSNSNNIKQGICTVVLRAPSESLVQEVERSFHDLLCVLNQVFPFNSSVIGGGGSLFLEAAQRLTLLNSNMDSSNEQFVDLITHYKEKEQVCIQQFAEALEELPQILVKNAGYDSLALLLKAREFHKQRDLFSHSTHPWMSVDLDSGTVKDMVNDLQIYEPSTLCKSVIQSATEATEMILRVDRVIINPPREEIKMHS